MSRIVVVSNRVSLPRGNRPPSGGLATAVLAALESRGGLWYGWSGNQSSDLRVERTRRGKVHFATIPLTKRDYEEYYKGYSNRVLWPLLHERLDRMEYRRSFADGYRRVNELFAKHLLPLLKPDDIIWIHDYHLVPLGRALRRAGCNQAIGFYLHVPFPPYDIFRALPQYRELLLELGAYDLVGFQSDVDLRGFQNSVRYGLPGSKVSHNAVVIGSQSTRTGIFPISIDVDDVAARAHKSRSSPAGRRLVDSLTGRRLIMGVDRLDYTKGLTERLRAFERLLERYGSVKGTIVFLQIAQPSRGDVPEYQQMRRALNSVAGEINGRYAEYDWVPLRYLNKGFAQTTILGFLSIAGIAFITPLRDGMNLVAKEFVASQDAKDPGVLVLSELTGAARELDGALIVNPYDVDDMADGLARAIAMPYEERKERWTSMIKVLRKQDIHQWRSRFVEMLETTKSQKT